ncbi:MAG: helix-turn-helix domain-containing protein [Candidatus Buchananbacteria bacterium]
MNNLQEQLKDIGLEIKEVDVYLGILSLGKSTVAGISRKCSIKRTTIYGHLDNLLQKGLIFRTVDKKRIYYCPEEPEKIKLSLDKQKREIDEKKSKIDKIIPELFSLYSGGFEKPKISFYEGKDGIMEIYWKILKTNKTVYNIFSPDSFFKLFSQIENHHLMMSLYNNGGVMKSLIEESSEPIAELKNKEYSKFTRTKKLPPGFKFETDLLVSGEVTAMISFKNLIGVIIEDRAISELQKNLIKNLWKQT